MHGHGKYLDQPISGVTKILGVSSLIAAILGVLVPVLGVIAITPIAIIFGVFALYGGYKGMGIATLVIVAVNLIISPTFWLNVWAGGHSGINRFLTDFDVIGVLVMLVLVAKTNKRKER